MTEALSHAPFALLAPSAQLVNAMLAFWGTLGCALLAARLAPAFALKKWVLLLPFARLAHDVSAGIPDDSYVSSAFAGSRWELGRFALGIGWSDSQLVPTVNLRLGALRAEHWYPLSAGDLCSHALFYRGAWWILATLLLLIALVACVRVVRRLVVWKRFLRETHGDWKCHRVGRLTLRRTLDAQQGAFASGVLAPVIWLPARGHGLSGPELRAIVRHELGHVRHGDVLLFAVIGVLTDLLWFVPGVGWIQRRIREAAERAADAWAVAHGAHPLALASALLKTGEYRAAGPVGAHAAGNGRTTRRVRELLFPTPRVAGWRAVLGALLSACVVISAMQACFFGYR